ncbi:OTU domain-containing protein 6B [Smittium mucronatum]|uniref:OTU domain-containing protein 6B n=1 Tax=Smittium mucronatum TaxID=133383 RepID=A0A1R0GYC3_9FUNG|nr:OTU domain-containing protein 6B [Smittium mucronatum]
MEELEARQRKEKKELVAKVTMLKKKAKSGDKSTKKTIQEDIERLESELKNKHEIEKLALETSAIDIADTVSEEQHPTAHLISDVPKESELSANNESSDHESLPIASRVAAHGVQINNSKPSKNRARKKLEKRRQEMLDMQKEAELEALNEPDKKKIEYEQLEKILSIDNLQIKQVMPNGHCLYNSIIDQLQILPTPEISSSSDIDEVSFILNGQEVPSVSKLRQIAANYMLENKDQFMPFMINEKTGDMMSYSEFLEHIKEISDTPLWAGHFEITALSNSFKRPILIYRADSQDPIRIGFDEGFCSNPPMRISYHRYAFGLGEHYNSVRPKGIILSKKT